MPYREPSSQTGRVSEVDTCRQYVVPKLQAAGWDNDPHSVAEQRQIMAGVGALQSEVDALKRLQAETAAELDTLLPTVPGNVFKGKQEQP